jgi:hypothetical protein
MLLLRADVALPLLLFLAPAPHFRYLSSTVDGGAEALAHARSHGSPPFLSYAWKPVLYIVGHALMSLLG